MQTERSDLKYIILMVLLATSGLQQQALASTELPFDVDYGTLLAAHYAEHPEDLDIDLDILANRGAGHNEIVSDQLVYDREVGTEVSTALYELFVQALDGARNPIVMSYRTCVHNCSVEHVDPKQLTIDFEFATTNRGAAYQPEPIQHPKALRASISLGNTPLRALAAIAIFRRPQSSALEPIRRPDLVRKTKDGRPHRSVY